LTIKILSSSSRRSVCDHPFADRVRPWCSEWTGENPDAVCGEDRIEGCGEPGIPISEQQLDRGGAVGEIHQEVAGGLGGPRPGRMCGHPDQMCPAGAMLDRDQRVNPSEQHGVDVQEVYGQDGLGLGGEKLSPAGTPPARRGIEAGVRQDLPHGGSGDAVAEPNQLALPAPVSPGGIFSCHPNDQLLDRCCGWRTFEMATCGVVPFPRDQSAVPGHDGGGSDREDLGPAMTWHKPGQGSQPHSADGPVVHPSDLSAQHGVLMPQHQQLGILAQVSPHQHGA
jgi:hypothetical protein